MQESIVFLVRVMSSQRKFTFAISFPDEFLVIHRNGSDKITVSMENSNHINYANETKLRNLSRISFSVFKTLA